MAGSDDHAAQPQSATGPALQDAAGFFAIMEAWGVTAEEARILLGGLSPSVFAAWRAGGERELPPEALRRAAYVIGMHQWLHIIYGENDHADSWIRRPNADFGGQPPLEFLKAGALVNFALVRSYLQAAATPW